MGRYSNFRWLDLPRNDATDKCPGRIDVRPCESDIFRQARIEPHATLSFVEYVLNEDFLEITQFRSADGQNLKRGTRFIVGAMTCILLFGCSAHKTDADRRVGSHDSLKETYPTAAQLRGIPHVESANGPSAEVITPPFFKDVTEEVGLDFTYLNGERGRALMIEPMGGGAGWLDYDRDDLFDLYVCQGGDATAKSKTDQPSDQLFRQVVTGRFENISPVAGIVERLYSMGVAIADYDNDGFDDVFVTNVGPDSLFHNQGDGSFRNVAIHAGVADPRWGTSAAWGDVNGDGDLDLYVCNYVNYDPLNPTPCGDGRICHPRAVSPAPDECFINQGNGTFRGEATKRGLSGPDNRALGVVIADLNNDRLPDIFVANDSTANFLFINQGHGQFRESALLLGCAVSREGLPQANMGVALGDYDHNGWLDLYCTHLTGESNTLYHNLGPAGFQDITGIVGLHAPTVPMLAFGTVMVDFNQDGHEEIFVANGNIDDVHEIGREEPPQLFSFAGGRFVDCGSKAGSYFGRKVIGRAAALADFDQDGDWDLVVVHQGLKIALLRNDSQRGHWLKLRLSAKNNRRGVGTRVTLTQGKRSLVQELAGGTSYCSSHEPALIFGLGNQSSECELEILWPDGRIQIIEQVSVDQSMTLKESF